MKQIRHALLLSAAISICAGQVSAPPASPDADKVPAREEAAQYALDAKTIQSLIGQLADTSYATRQRAQKELLDLPVAQLPILEDLAAKVTDAEARIRLKQILAALRTVEAMTLPPISLDVDNVTYPELADALSKATGTQIDGESLATHDRFTLHVTDRPFWDVIDQLTQQHPLTLGNGAAMTIKPSRDMSAHHRQFTRGVLFSVGEPQILANHFLALPANRVGNPVQHQSYELQVSASVAVDPRIIICESRLPRLETVLSHAGTRLATGTKDETPATFDTGSLAHIWGERLVTALSGDPGESFTLRCSVSFTVVAPKEQACIDNVRTHLNQPVTAGDLRVTVKQMVLPPAGVSDDGKTRIIGLKIESVPLDRTVRPPQRPDLEFTDGAFRIVKVPPAGKLAVPEWSRTLGMGAGGGVRTDGIDTFLYDGIQQFGMGEIQSGGEMLILRDADGKEVLSAMIPAGSATTSLIARQTAIKEPLSISFRDRREVTIPFEFKDLPVKH